MYHPPNAQLTKDCNANTWTGSDGRIGWRGLELEDQGMLMQTCEAILQLPAIDLQDRDLGRKCSLALAFVIPDGGPPLVRNQAILLRVLRACTSLRTSCSNTQWVSMTMKVFQPVRLL